MVHNITRMYTGQKVRWISNSMSLPVSGLCTAKGDLMLEKDIPWVSIAQKISQSDAIF